MSGSEEKTLSELLFEAELRLGRYRGDTYLAAARVVEALRLCLNSQVVFDAGRILREAGVDPTSPRPRTDDENRAIQEAIRRHEAAPVLLRCASDLLKYANSVRDAGKPEISSRYPAKSTEYQQAAAAIRETVVWMMKGSGGFDPIADSPSLARHVDLAGRINVSLGTELVLPGDSSSNERTTLFTAAIEKLRNNRPTVFKKLTTAVETLRSGATGPAVDIARECVEDAAEAVVKACARACGNPKANDLFGAERRRQQRAADRPK